MGWHGAALYTAVTGHALQTRFDLRFIANAVRGTSPGYGWWVRIRQFGHTGPWSFRLFTFSGSFRLDTSPLTHLFPNDRPRGLFLSSHIYACRVIQSRRYRYCCCQLMAPCGKVDKEDNYSPCALGSHANLTSATTTIVLPRGLHRSLQVYSGGCPWMRLSVPKVQISVRTASLYCLWHLMAHNLQATLVRYSLP